MLVAGLAHELGNPLTVLAGNMEPLGEALAAFAAALDARTTANGPGATTAAADARVDARVQARACARIDEARRRAQPGLC